MPTAHPLATMNHIDIEVETSYIESQSTPEEDRFVFAYAITIRNSGTEAARLLTRHWIITDANGKVQEVKGEGDEGDGGFQVFLFLLCLPCCVAPAWGGWGTEEKRRKRNNQDDLFLMNKSNCQHNNCTVKVF